jgi:hypothetical protein
MSKIEKIHAAYPEIKHAFDRVNGMRDALKTIADRLTNAGKPELAHELTEQSWGRGSQLIDSTSEVYFIAADYMKKYIENHSADLLDAEIKQIEEFSEANLSFIKLWMSCNFSKVRD